MADASEIRRQLLVTATQKMIELSKKPDWRLELPPRCPPIVWFGNSESTKPRILTLGANPSRQEYLATSRDESIETANRSGNHNNLEYLEPPDANRFRLPKSNEHLAEILETSSLQNEIIAGYDTYFKKAPYSRWFGKNEPDSYNVEGFIRGLGGSFYENNTKYQAIHIDLFPFATLHDFKSLSSLVTRDLFADGWAQGQLDSLIRLLNPHALVIFGKGNLELYLEHVPNHGFEAPHNHDVEKLKWKHAADGRFVLGNHPRLRIPMIGLSANLGNPRGFDKATIQRFGREVRAAASL
jgi:hypothetical protein